MAFYGCPALETIAIPNGVTKIQDGTFMYCTALQSISLPESLTEIGDRAFAECESLKTINVPYDLVDYYKEVLPEELHNKIVEREM